MYYDRYIAKFFVESNSTREILGIVVGKFWITAKVSLIANGIRYGMKTSSFDTLSDTAMFDKSLSKKEVSVLDTSSKILESEDNHSEFTVVRAGVATWL